MCACCKNQGDLSRHLENLYEVGQVSERFDAAFRQYKLQIGLLSPTEVKLPQTANERVPIPVL